MADSDFPLFEVGVLAIGGYTAYRLLKPVTDGLGGAATALQGTGQAVANTAGTVSGAVADILSPTQIIREVTNNVIERINNSSSQTHTFTDVLKTDPFFATGIKVVEAGKSVLDKMYVSTQEKAGVTASSFTSFPGLITQSNPQGYLLPTGVLPGIDLMRSSMLASAIKVAPQTTQSRTMMVPLASSPAAKSDVKTLQYIKTPASSSSLSSKSTTPSIGLQVGTSYTSGSGKKVTVTSYKPATKKKK